MQKKGQSIPPLLGGMLKKFKWFYVLFVFFFFGMTGQVEGQTQEKKITLNLKDATMAEFVKEVKRQTGYTFFYNDKASAEIEPITIQKENATLENVLQEVVGTKGFTFVIEDNTVVIKKTVVQPMGTVVKGKVVDSKNLPLPGVTVKLEDVIVGTSTDVNGKFQLTLPVKTGVLEFSFVGFKSRKVKFSETNKDSLYVIMEDDVQEMDEVVVTGYQMLKEKGMAGSYSRVKAEDLAMTGNETVESMLQGKLPGVMIVNQSGLTGTRQKVRVRGTSTLIGNADPVWVVDGIIQEDNLPFEASELGAISDDNLDMMKDFIGGAVSWLNPNDIEDITVLKDASATAIYGVKAANGVILITTKKGERGRMALNYTGNFSISQKMNYNRMEIMNSKDRVAFSREAFERGARYNKSEKVGYLGLALAYTRKEISWQEFNDRVKKLEEVNTNWFDILYQTPFSQAHSVSFSGGNDNATYRASFGYRNQQNTAKGNEQVAYTGNLNMSMVFWQKLTLTASLSGNHSETKAFASGVDPYNYAINTSRVIPCYDDNGDLFYYDKGGDKYNILNELVNSGNENIAKSLNLNLSARWRIYEDLTLSATLGGATSSSLAETWFTERSHKITGIRGYEYGAYGVLDKEYQMSKLPWGGMLTTSESQNFNYTARLQAEFVKVLNGVHAINLMAGWESRSTQYKGVAQTNWGYMPDRGKSFTDVPLYWGTSVNNENSEYARTTPKITDQLSNYLSYYVTGSYMYDNRYSINFSVRGDASNRFGNKGKFQTVYALGLRWNVTDEHWMQNQNLVNNLAFTASFGYQGNVVESVGPDLIAKVEAVDSETGEWRMRWKQLPNPDLKPEKTLSVNLGVNFAFFKSKVNGTFNWYYKKTTDLVTTSKVPYENGTTTMALNDGNVENKGWDLAFTVVPIRTKNFMWSLGTTFSGNDNSVDAKLKSTGSWKEATSGKLNKAGYPVGSFWAFKFTGLDAENGGPLFDFSRADTEKAAEDATEYMVYMGTREPTFTVGINMVLRWKRFSFPLNFYISRGNYEFLASPYENGYSILSEYQNASSELNKRWRKPGDEKHTNIPSIPVGENCRPLYPFEDKTTTNRIYPLDAWAFSDVRVVNAWYIRFNDLKLSYNLPDKWIKGFAKSIAVSFTATNPLQIKSKDFKGRDPEVALGQQPRSQNYSLGINLSF